QPRPEAAAAVVGERREGPQQDEEHVLEKVRAVGLGDAQSLPPAEEQRRVEADEPGPGGGPLGPAELVEQAGRRRVHQRTLAPVRSDNQPSRPPDHTPAPPAAKGPSGGETSRRNADGRAPGGTRWPPGARPGRITM